MNRIGLVLGAGGVVGHAYHAGTLAGLEEATGWDPRTAEIIVGTSAGSMVGALLRAGMPTRDLAARALGQPLSAATRKRMAHLPAPAAMALPMPSRRRPGDIPRPAALGYLARAAMTPWRMRAGTVAASVLPAGRVPTEMISDALRPIFGDEWPEAALWICAVKLGSGQLTVFGREGAPEVDVANAVRASCAIPGYFSPAEINGARYVDGGAHSPTNADLLANMGLDLVVVLSPMSAVRNIGLRSMGSQIRSVHAFRLGREAAAVKRGGTPIVAFQPTADDVAVMGINAMDPGRRGGVARQARESAMARLERADMKDRLSPLSDHG